MEGNVKELGLTFSRGNFNMHLIKIHIVFLYNKNKMKIIKVKENGDIDRNKWNFLNMENKQTNPNATNEKDLKK